MVKLYFFLLIFIGFLSFFFSQHPQKSFEITISKAIERKGLSQGLLVYACNVLIRKGRFKEQYKMIIANKANPYQQSKLKSKIVAISFNFSVDTYLALKKRAGAFLEGERKEYEIGVACCGGVGCGCQGILMF